MLASEKFFEEDEFGWPFLSPYRYSRTIVKRSRGLKILQRVIVTCAVAIFVLYFPKADAGLGRWAKGVRRVTKQQVFLNLHCPDARVGVLELSRCKGYPDFASSFGFNIAKEEGKFILTYHCKAPGWFILQNNRESSCRLLAAFDEYKYRRDHSILR